MKKAITGVAAVALITVVGVSTGHAWSFAPSFKKQSSTTQSSGRDSQSFGKNSAGRDRTDIKNSFNRTNSPEISNSKQVFTGSTGSNHNVMQSAGQVRDIGNGTAKNARFSGIGSGNFRNDGLIGNNAGASQSANSGVNIGDSINTGNTNTYMGSDAITAQTTMNKDNNDLERARIEAKK